MSAPQMSVFIGPELGNDKVLEIRVTAVGSTDAVYAAIRTPSMMLHIHGDSIGDLIRLGDSISIQARVLLAKQVLTGQDEAAELARLRPREGGGYLGIDHWTEADRCRADDAKDRAKYESMK